MVNATVSHELRNPLNAIIDQQNNYKKIFDIITSILSIVIEQIKN
jgi:signal transduction histidine kinase